MLDSVHTEWMTHAERADFDVLTDKWQGYLATAGQLKTILSSGAPDAARQVSVWLNDDKNGQLVAYVELSDISTRMVTEVKVRAATTAADAEAQARSYRTATLVALLSALLLAWAVQLSVTRPLGRCVAALQALGRKDLSVRLDLDTRDEMGDMARALDDATGGMRAAVVDMGGSVETLTSASSGLSDVAARLSASAQQVSGQAQARPGWPPTCVGTCRARPAEQRRWAPRSARSR